MKDKLIKVITNKNVLTAASLILLGLSQMVSGRLSEETIRDMVKEEIENISKQPKV